MSFFSRKCNKTRVDEKKTEGNLGSVITFIESPDGSTKLKPSKCSLKRGHSGPHQWEEEKITFMYNEWQDFQK